MDAMGLKAAAAGIGSGGPAEATGWAAIAVAAAEAKRAIAAAGASAEVPGAGPLDGLSAGDRDAVRAVAEAYRDAKVTATGVQLPLSRAIAEIESGGAEKLAAQRCRVAASMTNQDFRALIARARGQEPSAAATAEREGKAAPAIRDPEAPATEAQTSLISDLVDHGVISFDEAASIGPSPTKEAASKLISSHEGAPGFSEVIAERRAARRAAKEGKASEQAGGREAGKAPQRPGIVHMRFPNSFVHHYQTRPNEQGRVYDKAICAIPKGVRVNGLDMSGYAIDVFLGRRQMDQKSLGRPVTVTVPADKPVTAFIGKGEARREVALNPWDLTGALKDERERFAGERAAAREAARAPEPPREADGRADAGLDGAPSADEPLSLSELAAEKADVAESGGYRGAVEQTHDIA